MLGRLNLSSRKDSPNKLVTVEQPSEARSSNKLRMAIWNHISVNWRKPKLTTIEPRQVKTFSNRLSITRPKFRKWMLKTPCDSLTMARWTPRTPLDSASRWQVETEVRAVNMETLFFMTSLTVSINLTACNLLHHLTWLVMGTAELVAGNPAWESETEPLPPTTPMRLRCCWCLLKIYLRARISRLSETALLVLPTSSSNKWDLLLMEKLKTNRISLMAATPLLTKHTTTSRRRDRVATQDNCSLQLNKPKSKISSRPARNKSLVGLTKCLSKTKIRTTWWGGLTVLARLEVTSLQTTPLLRKLPKGKLINSF